MARKKNTLPLIYSLFEKGEIDPNGNTHGRVCLECGCTVVDDIKFMEKHRQFHRRLRKVKRNEHG